MATTLSRVIRVAVVDDDRHIREMLEVGLGREGFTVRSASDGQAGLALVREWDPEVIVLDVMMPKIDGVALIPMLRRLTHAPIVMLTAKAEMPDKIAGLSAGADDYIVKPFFLEELKARLEAAIRRPKLVVEKELRWGSLTLDLDRRELFRDNERIELTPREFELLAVLMREPLRVFSKQHLIDVVWGYDFNGSIGVVETYVSYLRAKIDRDPNRSCIRTVRGVGYALARYDTA